jgi:addiction module HigA family antidote
MLPTHREPTHPGEVLAEEFMKPLEMSAADLASELKTRVELVNNIIDKRQGVTRHDADLLAGVFKTTSEFWLNLQKNYDEWHAQEKARG